MVQSSVHSTLVSDGYAAFNADDWDTVKALFCEDIAGASGEPELPAWYLMHGQGVIRGREKIFTYLEGLRAAAVKAKLVGVADHGNTAITLDVTTGGSEGPHVCSDKIEFDESGHIKVFWHCSTNTHGHGHAGHEEGHTHSPSS